MEPPDSQQCHIFVVAPVKEDYKTAELLLHEKYYELPLKPSGATCIVGRIGSHCIALAGNGEDMLDIASFTNNTVNDILKELPSIKAGFLIGVGGIAPAAGIAKIGDVVAGTSRGLEPGLVQFDASKTTQLNRLSVTHQIARPPAVVLSAVEELRSWRGRLEFQKELFNKAMTIYDAEGEKENLSWSNSVKAIHGKVASSETDLTREEVFNKAGHESKVFCFERAAANLKPSLPILTICGIRHITNSSDGALKKQRSGTAAVIYTFLIVSRIETHLLKKQHIFNDLFCYDSFSLERPGFRLVRLERGTQPLLRCSLFQAYLDDRESIIPYEALSYVWGSYTACYEIITDGKIMSITASLHDALIHLRQPNEDRILWIDALCIDQSNIKERSHQVNHMGEIYRKSHNVIVWLGYVSGDAVVMKTIVDEYTKQLPSGAFENWSRGDQRWRDQWQEAEKSLGISDYTKVLNGLNMFTTNPWFTRVWVLQEVANARTAVMECNLGKIPARLFVMLPQIIGSPVSEQCQAVLEILPSPSKATSWWVQDRNLGTLLYKFKGSEASDPRDRVYALLGMASDIDASGIEADYAKEEQVIVQDLCDYIYGERFPVGISSTTTIHDLQSQLPKISAGLLADKLEQKNTTECLQLFLSRQGMVKSVSDYVFHKLLDHGSLPTNTYLNKCEVPFFTNLASAERFLLRYPDVFVTFVQEQGIPPFMLQKIASLMIKNQYDGLQSFLEVLTSAIDPEPKLIIHLMEYSPGKLKPLLISASKAFREPIHMNETVFTHAIEKGKTTLNLLLQNCRHPIMITTNVLVKAIKADIETLRVILKAPRNVIHIEDATFSEAALKGPATLHLLLDHCGGEVLISKLLLLIAIGCGPSILNKALDMSSDVSPKIDASVFTAAATRAPQAVRILLDHCKHSTRTMAKSIYCAVRYEPYALWTLLEMSPYKIELDKKLFVRAVLEGPEKLQLLFHYCIKPINVTKKMLGIAIKAGIPILEVIFDNWAFDIETTELITKQAAMAGIQTLEYLITNSRSKIQITNNILQKSRAVDSSYHKLAELRDSETDVTEHEAITAIESGLFIHGSAVLEYEADLVVTPTEVEDWEDISVPTFTA
ncbi:hypothetical protein FIE12Z_553 [Fusarium flagelliforme]|uniref:Heterokaryon incompatibility domain-containing protein n=1 Tax=Fusarium flagelliforme TaxID=2675880 RepID=A0A395N5Z9_9HYPO|nr:hypothetical protein FIE12Z_553 [Fusarium flagelliforme]